MDKIWDRNSFEVGGLWPLWRGMKKTEWPRSTDKSRTLKNTWPVSRVFFVLREFHIRFWLALR